MKHAFFIILTILITVGPTRADSIASAPYVTDTVRFDARQLIAPASLITVGALGVGVKPLKQARTWVSNEIGVHKCSPADDVLQYLPGVSYLVLDYCGVKSRKPLVDRAIVGATSVVALVVLTRGIKLCVNEERPDGRDHNSFPSGHTATAFMGAELLRRDYGHWAGAAGYTVATAVGVMRILNGRHWLNDVLAGAGCGILAANIGEWLLPFNRRWMGLDRKRGSAMAILPAYEPQYGVYSVTAAMIF